MGDLGSIPGMGRSPGGHGNPLQYSCMENPHGQRSLADYSPQCCKESDMIVQLSTTQHTAGYKINMQKSIAFLYANNKISGEKKTLSCICFLCAMINSDAEGNSCGLPINTERKICMSVTVFSEFINQVLSKTSLLNVIQVKKGKKNLQNYLIYGLKLSNTFKYVEVNPSSFSSTA